MKAVSEWQNIDYIFLNIIMRLFARDQHSADDCAASCSATMTTGQRAVTSQFSRAPSVNIALSQCWLHGQCVLLHQLHDVMCSGVVWP